MFLFIEEEKNQIWSIHSIILKPSILCLHEWTLDFKLDMQKFMNSQSVLASIAVFNTFGCSHKCQ